MVCGVRLGDDVHVVPWGVANVATGAPVVPSTLFQLGSITKVYTATLVMQAVQAGLVGLDEPVRSQLQEFSVADPGATIEITPRHLLTHTSGIEGDHLIDTGWNPDALARYVATLAGLGQLHPTDEAYSFCNTGYGVLGRLLEVATGDDFDKVLRRRLTRPLGCRATVTLPHHALLHSVAVGHAPDPRPIPRPARPAGRSPGPTGRWGASWRPPTSCSPSPALHLDEGRTAVGRRPARPGGRGGHAAPARRHAAARRGPGARVDGAPVGRPHQPGARRRHVRPAGRAPGRPRARRFAACVMVNSPLGGSLAQTLLGHLAADLLDVTAPDPGDPRGTGAAGDPRRPGRRDREPTTGSTSGSRWRPTATRLLVATEPSGVLQALGVKGAVLDAAPTGLSATTAP